MMDRLLNIPGPPLGSIENIELARFRSKAFDTIYILANLFFCLADNRIFPSSQKQQR
jgi:hypothetical protein